MPQVSLIHCKGYQLADLKDKIYTSLSNIGFDVKQFNKARVVVKPNLLMPAKEEKAIITNSVFYRAVVQIVREDNISPVLVESPAIHSLYRVIKKTYYAEVVESENV